MLDLKTYFINRLKQDKIGLAENYAAEDQKLDQAIERLEALTDQEVIDEMTSQDGNVRHLAQFISFKKDRDAAKAALESTGGELTE